MPTQIPSGPRWTALLRAINVGGHTLKMDALRALFEELGYTQVETLIASGNVLFADGSAAGEGELQRQIEAHLQAALGYAVITFLRSPAEVRAAATYQPFDQAEWTAGGQPAGADSTLYISFLPETPDAEAQAMVHALGTPADAFHFHGRELYWLRRGRISESRISGGLLEKTLKLPLTMRNAATVQKLARLHGEI